MVEETGNESGGQKGSTQALSCDPRPSLGTGRINEEQMVAPLRSVLLLQNAHLSESLSTAAAFCCITRTTRGSWICAKHEKPGLVMWRARALLLRHAGTMNDLQAHAGISGLPCVNLLQAFEGMRAKSHVLSRVCGKCVCLQGSTGSSGCLEQTLR